MDLDRLINEVMQMVRDRQDPNSRYNQNEEYKLRDEKERIRNFELEKQRQGGAQNLALEETKGRNTLANTGLTNTGRMDERTAMETGATTRNAATIAGEQARNELTQATAKRGHELEFEGKGLTSAATRYASENVRAGQEARARATTEAATIGLGKGTDPRGKLLEVWAGSTNPTPESLTTMKKGYDTLYPAVPSGANKGNYYKDEDTRGGRSFEERKAPYTATPPVGISAPAVNTSRIAPPPVSDPIAEALAAKRLEDARRARERVNAIIPQFQNRSWEEVKGSRKGNSYAF